MFRHNKNRVVGCLVEISTEDGVGQWEDADKSKEHWGT